MAPSYSVTMTYDVQRTLPLKAGGYAGDVRKLTFDHECCQISTPVIELANGRYTRFTVIADLLCRKSLCGKSPVGRPSKAVLPKPMSPLLFYVAAATKIPTLFSLNCGKPLLSRGRFTTAQSLMERSSSPTSEHGSGHRQYAPSPSMVHFRRTKTIKQAFVKKSNQNLTENRKDTRSSRPNRSG